VREDKGYLRKNAARSLPANEWYARNTVKMRVFFDADGPFRAHNSCNLLSFSKTGQNFNNCAFPVYYFDKQFFPNIAPIFSGKSGGLVQFYASKCHCDQNIY
jgi:hypothetical protein